jgi:hypothetical protein
MYRKEQLYSGDSVSWGKAGGSKNSMGGGMPRGMINVQFELQRIGMLKAAKQETGNWFAHSL